MLKRFRKGKTEEEPEEYKVVYETGEQPKVVGMTKIDASGKPDFSNLPAEERTLKEAEWALQEVIAQDGSLDEEAHNAEIVEAERVAADAQAKLSQMRADKDARFHAANKKLLDAQADILLAAQQKAQYDHVVATLERFKATPIGKDIPDDIAMILSLLLEGVPAQQVNGVLTTYQAYQKRRK